VFGLFLFFFFLFFFFFGGFCLVFFCGFFLGFFKLFFFFVYWGLVFVGFFFVFFGDVTAAAHPHRPPPPPPPPFFVFVGGVCFVWGCFRGGVVTGGKEPKELVRIPYKIPKKTPKKSIDKDDQFKSFTRQGTKIREKKGVRKNLAVWYHMVLWPNGATGHFFEKRGRDCRRG